MYSEDFAFKCGGTGFGRPTQFRSKERPVYQREQLIPYSTWRHLKTDSLYVVLGVGTCSTNGPNEHREESVIYVSLSHQHLCYREVSQFLDGRFEPCAS